MTAPAAPPQVAVATQSQLPRGDITRVLGADAPPPVDPAAGESLASAPADARFQLVGVVAPRGSETARAGVALIAVDGKPAKAYRVGAVVDGDHVVQAIRLRGADLGPAGGSVAVALNIPPPAPAATGTLPDAGTPGASTPPPPPPAVRPAPAAAPMVAPQAPAPAPRRGVPVNPAASPVQALQPLPAQGPSGGPGGPQPAAPGGQRPQIR